MPSSLLNVNTIQSAAGGSFDQYLKTPLRDWSLHTANTISTNTWYAYDYDLFVIVNPTGSYGSHCYYTFNMVPANISGITSGYYIESGNLNYSTYAIWTTSAYVVPKDWVFRVVNDYGSAPNIRTYRLS